MSSLAERLKQKGFELIDERPPVPMHQQLAGAPHKSLAISAKELRVFAPLEGNSQKAEKAEEKFQKDCGKDLLKGVRKTVLTWVQECLSNPEKRQQLQEKGLLKCRVQAQWSEDLNKDLRAFIEGFGGRVAAASEKENAAERPAWEKYAARDEKWTVGFDTAAFESFIKSNPQVLGPSDCQLRDFIEKYSSKVDLEVCTMRLLFEALAAQFGPLSDSLKKRSQRITSEVAKNLQEERRGRGKKRQETDGNAAAKRPRISGPPGLWSPEDAAWASQVIAPLGLRPGSNELAAKAPVSILAPVLAGLKNLDPSVELLRSTNLGVIVGSYRQHPSPEIARVAKELVASWKAACQAKKIAS